MKAADHPQTTGQVVEKIREWAEGEPGYSPPRGEHEEERRIGFADAMTEVIEILDDAPGEIAEGKTIVENRAGISLRFSADARREDLRTRAKKLRAEIDGLISILDGDFASAEVEVWARGLTQFATGIEREAALLRFAEQILDANGEPSK